MAKIVIKRGDRSEAVKLIQDRLGVSADGIFGAETEQHLQQWQHTHGLPADGVFGALTMQRMFGFTLEKSVRTITEIIVHCTATPEGKDFTVNDIRRWHKDRGWPDIGYHYVVYRDGTIHDGRSVHLRGIHCSGHNSYSVGVVYIGGVMTDGKTPKDTRTLAQKAALIILLTFLRHLYPKAKIYGHRDFANKACPSFDARREYSNISTH